MEAEEPIPDRVERAAPDAAGVARAQARRSRDHLASGPPAEREEQDALRARPSFDEGRDTRRQRHGLPAAGAGDDQQRPLAMANGRLLLRIQLLEHAFEG